MDNKHICHSGGCPGADMEWEEKGRKHSVHTIAYSFPSHKQYGENRHILTSDELLEGFEQCKLASKPLGRTLYNVEKNPYVRNLISRNWFQVKNSEAIFAIGIFFDETKTKVNGGTGWAVQMAINNRKPIYFFDQDSDKWYYYHYSFNVFAEYDGVPELTKNFAGIGSRDLRDNGKQAITNVYKNTFKK
jgi:hypothetical protein